MRAHSIDQIRQALSHIPAAVPRDHWVRHAMAIKSEFPDENGFELFDSWSQTAPEQYSRPDTLSTWRSIRPEGGVGIGSLLREAKACGFLSGDHTTGAPAPRPAPRQAAPDDLAERQQKAAHDAAQRWAAAAPADPAHPYLQRKGIEPHGLRQDAGGLLVPMQDVGGTMHSLQVIDERGDKRFLPGGRVKGCFFMLGEPGGTLIVCEGFATGASLHAATGHAIAAAFSAGNLLAVAQALRQQYPDARLILAADDDVATPGNPGLTAARATAAAAGGLLAVPDFGPDRPQGASDFNDQHQQAGLDAVRACIKAARPVGTGPAPAAEKLFPMLHDDAHDEADASAPWPEPVPLAQILEPEAYPINALPQALREAVQEVQGFCQAPLPMVATSALSALSMAAQGLHDVKRAERLTGPVGLFTLVVADSGERKTTSDEFFLPAIKQWERAQAERLQPELVRYKAERAAWDAEQQGILAKIKEHAKAGKSTDNLRRTLTTLQEDEPKAPIIPRLLYSDITPEELGYQLAKRWPSAAISASEGGAVLGGHGMTGDSAMRSMARLNDLWSGQDVSSDRRTVESWSTHGARLTVGLQVQETTLRAFFEKSQGLARGTGFLARFLVAWPRSTQGTRKFKDAPERWPKLAAFHQRIERILSAPMPLNEHGGLSPSALPLSDKARQEWVCFHDAIEAQLGIGADFADLRDVASKCADNAARLAALFHIFEHGGGGAVGLEAMQGGCLIAAWHLEEARRFFGGLALPQDLADAQRLAAFVADYARACGVIELPTRELQRLGPVRQKERLHAALRELHEHHHVRLRTEGKRRLVAINPALLGRAAP